MSDAANRPHTTLRAHHLPNLREYVKDGIRLHWDESTGYTLAFAKAHDAVLASIVGDPEGMVRLAAGPDDICNCGVCPNVKPRCSSPELAETDRQAAARFGLVADKEYRAKDLIAAAVQPVLCLSEVGLKNGEKMVVKMVTPPAGEYADKLLHFFEHKRDVTFRNIRQRLRGDYTTYCIDRYFVGEIGGRIAGQVWYGYSNSGTGVANFGEVYTEPEHRNKGVLTELMKVFAQNFTNSPARAALCTAGAGQAAATYCKFGFQPVIAGADRGPHILVKQRIAANFSEFERAYYTPGQEISVSIGSMKHRHDIDTLLRFSTILRRGAEHGDPLKYSSASGASLAMRVGMATHVANYMDACFQAEDGRGMVTVAATGKGNVVGWSFFLNTGSEMEQQSKVFDFELHPTYAGSASTLIKESLRLARENGVKRACSFCLSADAEKIALLRAAGFREAAKLPNHCQVDGRTCDLVVLCCE
ncbi:MAG: GNAT family N-acetyltransferase [Planctomycetota bacterium]